MGATVSSALEREPGAGLTKKDAERIKKRCAVHDSTYSQQVVLVFVHVLSSASVMLPGTGGKHRS